MPEMYRYSPVGFDSRSKKTVLRNDWTVVLEYENEEDGPHLVDLSHIPRWDIQDENIENHRPFGILVPPSTGESRLENGVLINRMNRDQVSVWQLSADSGDPGVSDNWTDISDGTVLFGIAGKETFYILEKLTALDFRPREKRPPFLLQGPVCHVPSQAVFLGVREEKALVLFSASRGYANDMARHILKAGQEFNLRPGGENIISNWLKGGVQ